jgi:chromosome partitioning protein
MPKTIATVNPKGGVGKTTVAIHLAVAAHRAGHQVTLLSADPQGSALDWHGRTPDGYDGPVVKQLQGNRTLAAAIGQARSDIVIIDSPARLDQQTGRVLTNSDLALVPIRPSVLDLWGTAEFLEVLREHVGRGLKAAFVGSQRDLRTNLSGELDETLSQLDPPLLRGLSLRVSYAWSISEGKTVLDGPDTTAAGEVETLYSDAAGLL